MHLRLARVARVRSERGCGVTAYAVRFWQAYCETCDWYGEPTDYEPDAEGEAEIHDDNNHPEDSEPEEDYQQLLDRLAEEAIRNAQQ